MALTEQDYFAAYRFVGQYMQLWALVENRVTRVLTAACELDSLFGYVIGSNTAVKDKIAIARTSVAMVSRLGDWRKQADHVLQQAASAAADRNMIAHNLFDAVEGCDGAVFMRVLAKSELHFSDLHWSAVKFNETFSHLTDIRKHLEDIEADILSLPLEWRASVIADNPPASYGNIPPARLSVELPPPQNDPDIDQPKPKPRHERKQENQAKELRALRAQVAEMRAAAKAKPD